MNKEENMMKKRVIWMAVIVLVMLACAVACSKDPGESPDKGGVSNGSADAGGLNDDAGGLTESDKTKFSTEDKLLGVLSSSMNEKDVIAAIGKPEREEIVGIVGNGKEYHYNGFTLYFFSHNPDYGFAFAGLRSDAPGKEVIRGLSVGSKKEDVINAFYHENRPEGYRSIDRDILANSHYSFHEDAVSGKWLYGDSLIEYSHGLDNIAEYGAIFSLAGGTEQIVYSSKDSQMYIIFSFGPDNCVTSIRLGFVFM
jgi:hypothetical protein